LREVEFYLATMLADKRFYSRV